MKKILSLALAVVLLTFLSCGTVENETVKETSVNNIAEENEIIEIKDSIPDDLNFNGATLTILCRTSPAYAVGQNEFVADEETGDNFNDAVYRRNTIVEDRLNIKLNTVYDTYDKVPAMIRTSVAAGDHTYDLVAGFAANTPPLAAEGYFMNLFDVQYIDFARPWWNQNIINESTVGGKLNFIVGDANISVFGYCMSLFVNKKLMAEYDLPYIYDVIFENKWTLDYMNGYIKDIYKDLNGDGVADDNDLYGFIIPNHSAHMNPFMEAGGMQVTKIGSEGNPYFAMDTERMSGLVNKVYDILYNNNGTVIVGGDDRNNIMFKNDQGVFVTGGFSNAALYRDMESDFGIIPYPKYDEKQGKYLGGVAPYYSLFCIPVNSVTSDMTGAAMEAMSSESYKSVTPVYFDVLLKVKFARDEVTSKMIDLIRESAYIDFSILFNESINNPWGTMYELVGKKSNNFASWYGSNNEKIQLAIEKLLDQMNSAEY